MARPMVLMQEDLLNEIWYKHAQGVPVLAVIRQFDLDGKITAPTLTKLLSYVTAMQDSSEEVSNLIYKSLFPVWLTDNEAIIVTNPPDFYYTGKMPLGRWIKRGTELPKAAPVAKPKAPVKPTKGKSNGKR